MIRDQVGDATLNNDLFNQHISDADGDLGDNIEDADDNAHDNLQDQLARRQGCAASKIVVNGKEVSTSKYVTVYILRSYIGK